MQTNYPERNAKIKQYICLQLLHCQELQRLSVSILSTSKGLPTMSSCVDDDAVSSPRVAVQEYSPESSFTTRSISRRLSVVLNRSSVSSSRPSFFHLTVTSPLVVSPTTLQVNSMLSPTLYVVLSEMTSTLIGPEKFKCSIIFNVQIGLERLNSLGCTLIEPERLNYNK